MNFMDYTDDSCRNMFTKQQSQTMNNQIAPGSESYSLICHPNVLKYPTTYDTSNRFKVYPNPSTGCFYIDLIKPINKATCIKILDVTGRVNHEVFIESNKQTNYFFDFSRQSKGVYVAEITFGNEKYFERIILN
jgi:hypothetical protein